MSDDPACKIVEALQDVLDRVEALAAEMERFVAAAHSAGLVQEPGPRDGNDMTRQREIVRGRGQ